MKKALFAGIAFALPYVAFAQSVNSFLDTAGSILNRLIPLLILLALVVFFWGLIQYIVNPGEGHANGRTKMIAGLLALFIMLTVFGIIKVAQNTLGIGNNANDSQIQYPQIQTGTNVR
jgi:hypothetical protein